MIRTTIHNTVIWLLLSTVIAVALILTSCALTGIEEEAPTVLPEEQPTVTEEEGTEARDDKDVEQGEFEKADQPAYCRGHDK